MNPEDEILKKFDKYLKNLDMSAIDDLETKELIKEHYNNEALKKKWASIIENNKDQNKESPIVRSFNGKRLRIVSIILATAACFALFVFMPFSQSDPLEEYISLQYEKPFTRDVLKGTETKIETRALAFQKYQNKEYHLAIPLFEQQTQSGNTQQSDFFFLGLSYLYNDQADLAVSQFKYVLEQNGSNFHDSAVWYLGLALAESGQYELAIEQFKIVTQWSGNKGKLDFAKKAEKMISLINEMKE